MIVVTVARKPIIGTVSRNAAQYLTGGLNVNGCRIQSGGEVHLPQSDPSNRVGEVGKNFGFAESSVTKMHQAQRESIERTNALGRWPANIILEHRDECIQSGTKKVKTPKHSTGYTVLKRTFGADEKNFIQKNKWDHVDADGTETVLHWECSPGCPVAEMNQQADALNLHPAGFKTDGTHCPSKGGFGPVPIMLGGNPAYRYGDRGSVSRFFKQFGGQQ